jgi:hypothetical protein
VEKPLHPAIPTVLTAQPQHGGGVTHWLVGRVYLLPAPVLDAALLFIYSSAGGEQIEEGQPARGKQRLHSLNHLPRSSIGILASQRVHAHVAHENREACDKAGMPVAEGIVIPPHLVKHVVRHRFGVSSELGVIVVVEHRKFNPRGADVSTTRPTGQIVSGNCRDGDFALELSQGAWHPACQAGIQLPPGVQTGNPDPH